MFLNLPKYQVEVFEAGKDENGAVAARENGLHRLPLRSSKDDSVRDANWIVTERRSVEKAEMQGVKRRDYRPCSMAVSQDVFVPWEGETMEIFSVVLIKNKHNILFTGFKTSSHCYTRDPSNTCQPSNVGVKIYSPEKTKKTIEYLVIADCAATLAIF